MGGRDWSRAAPASSVWVRQTSWQMDLENNGTTVTARSVKRLNGGLTNGFEHVRTGAHIHGLSGEPNVVDADHLASSRTKQTHRQDLRMATPP